MNSGEVNPALFRLRAFEAELLEPLKAELRMHRNSPDDSSLERQSERLWDDTELLALVLAEEAERWVAIGTEVGYFADLAEVEPPLEVAAPPDVDWVLGVIRESTPPPDRDVLSFARSLAEAREDLTEERREFLRIVCFAKEPDWLGHLTEVLALTEEFLAGPDASALWDGVERVAWALDTFASDSHSDLWKPVTEGHRADPARQSPADLPPHLPGDWRLGLFGVVVRGSPVAWRRLETLGEVRATLQTATERIAASEEAPRALRARRTRRAPRVPRVPRQVERGLAVGVEPRVPAHAAWSVGGLDGTHGSETYFVVGEGLLSESVGGRASVAAAAGAPVEPAAAAPPFRFSRLGPKGAGKQLGEPNRKKIAAAMAVSGGGQSQIPAGFTYLGQFIDHDLTFDKTSVMLGPNVTPAELLQGRSPSLDLDSLYGAGPADPASATFYEFDGVHLKVGKTTGPTKIGFDLPRGTGSTVARKRKAIIPDPRNDENLAVAQHHCAMIRFHNRVVDTLPASVPVGQRFATAREIVTKHYQWMIRTDYLPRVAAPAVVNDVFNNGRKAFEVRAGPTDVPTMPIEFSVAVFRLGHSMVRARYNWNAIFDDGGGTLEFLFIFSALGGDLGGDTRLASVWIADFRRLYDFGEANKQNLTVPAAKFNQAMRIDTTIVDPLQHLPPKAIGLPASAPFNDPRRNLAFRNLTRAKMVKLATGQQMAKFLKDKGVNLTKLTSAQIRDGNNGADLSALTQAQRQALLKDTPLWFYILREAEINNGKLKGVGARIAAETFHRAMEGSEHSIVRDPSFAPTLGPNSNTFRMVDLLLFAFEGKKALLAPNG